MIFYFLHLSFLIHGLSLFFRASGWLSQKCGLSWQLWVSFCPWGLPARLVGPVFQATRLFPFVLIIKRKILLRIFAAKTHRLSQKIFRIYFLEIIGIGAFFRAIYLFLEEIEIFLIFEYIVLFWQLPLSGLNKIKSYKAISDEIII